MENGGESSATFLLSQLVSCSLFALAMFMLEFSIHIEFTYRKSICVHCLAYCYCQGQFICTCMYNYMSGLFEQWCSFWVYSLVQVGWSKNLVVFSCWSGLVQSFGCRNALGTSSVWCFNVDHLVCVQTNSSWVHIDVLDGWYNTRCPKMLLSA